MPIKAQNESMRYLKTAIIKNNKIGMEQIIANEEKPALINDMIAKKNRRRSNKNLPPPKMLAYDENEPFIRLYLVWLFSVAVKPSCDKR